MATASSPAIAARRARTPTLTTGVPHVVPGQVADQKVGAQSTHTHRQQWPQHTAAQGSDHQFPASQTALAKCKNEDTPPTLVPTHEAPTSDTRPTGPASTTMVAAGGRSGQQSPESQPARTRIKLEGPPPTPARAHGTLKPVPERRRHHSAPTPSYCWRQPLVRPPQRLSHQQRVGGRGNDVEGGIGPLKSEGDHLSTTRIPGNKQALTA